MTNPQNDLGNMFFFILGPSLKATTIRNKDGIRSHQITHLYPIPCYHILPCVYLESKWPLYLKINPPKQVLFQSKRGRGSFPNHYFFKGYVNEFQGVRIKLHPCSFLFYHLCFFLCLLRCEFLGGEGWEFESHKTTETASASVVSNPIILRRKWRPEVQILRCFVGGLMVT